MRIFGRVTFPIFFDSFFTFLDCDAIWIENLLMFIARVYKRWCDQIFVYIYNSPDEGHTDSYDHQV